MSDPSTPAGSSSDEFLPDASEDTSSAYDPTKFFTAARDRKGFSTTARVHLPPSVLSQISALVARQVIPDYKTTPDFIRDAVVHRLMWLGDNMGEIELTDAGRTLIAESRSEQFLRNRQAVKKTIDNYEGALREADRENQLEILASMRDDLRATRDATFRNQLTALVQRYE